MNDTAKWLVKGVILTLLASAIAPFTDDVTPLIPLPIQTYAMFFFVGYGYLLFLPTVFLATFLATSSRPWFGSYVLAAAAAVTALDAYWFSRSWDAGLGYQGRYFTIAVAIENAVGFAAVLSLAVVGRRARSRRLQAWAYVLLFMLLGWCAFPLFGHYPT